MHSLNHSAFAAATAAARLERRSSVRPAEDDRRAPPVRRGLAAAMTRVAVRLDAETARRSVA